MRERAAQPDVALEARGQLLVRDHLDRAARRALVPLSEMFGYATSVRSATQGRATFTMQFENYMEVPSSIAQEIKEKTGAAAD